MLLLVLGSGCDVEVDAGVVRDQPGMEGKSCRMDVSLYLASSNGVLLTQDMVTMLSMLRVSYVCDVHTIYDAVNIGHHVIYGRSGFRRNDNECNKAD